MDNSEMGRQQFAWRQRRAAVCAPVALRGGCETRPAKCSNASAGLMFISTTSSLRLLSN